LKTEASNNGCAEYSRESADSDFLSNREQRKALSEIPASAVVMLVTNHDWTLSQPRCGGMDSHVIVRPSMSSGDQRRRRPFLRFCGTAQVAFSDGTSRMCSAGQGLSYRVPIIKLVSLLVEFLQSRELVAWRLVHQLHAHKSDSACEVSEGGFLVTVVCPPSQRVHDSHPGTCCR
jgi:hypothetical protein